MQKKPTTPKEADVAPILEKKITASIIFVRGHKILLDRDLALLYGIETKNLNKAVRRNLDRFPSDFMFQLTSEEAQGLRFQIGTLKRGQHRKYLPLAFTEQGVAMLSSVLNSPRAVQVNIAIMRAFVRLRQIIASHEDLARKLDALERKYDEQFKAVFEAIRALMAPSVEADEAEPKREMGFHVRDESVADI